MSGRPTPHPDRPWMAQLQLEVTGTITHLINERSGGRQPQGKSWAHRDRQSVSWYEKHAWPFLAPLRALLASYALSGW